MKNSDWRSLRRVHTRFYNCYFLDKVLKNAFPFLIMITASTSNRGTFHPRSCYKQYSLEEIIVSWKKTRLRFSLPVAETDHTTWSDRSTIFLAYCLPDFLFDRSPLVDFLVLVSGLHLLVSRRVFSQEASLFAFKWSSLVICWFTHPLHVPFSYRQAFLHFFCIVLVCSQDLLSPFLRFSVRDRVLVFESHSDHWPFTYLHDEVLPDARSLVPRTVRTRTSVSSSSQRSDSALAVTTMVNRAIPTNAKLHHSFILRSFRGCEPSLLWNYCPGTTRCLVLVTLRVCWHARRCRWW